MSSTADASIEARNLKRAPEAGSKYHERIWRRLMRWFLGMAWSLKPPRILGVPATLWMVFSHYAGLRKVDTETPDPEMARKWPDGLVGICPNLEVSTLLSGYKAGLFPFSHVGPKKWWAPSMRMVLSLPDFHMEKNLRRLLRRKEFRVTFNSAFEDVMWACAAPRAGRHQLTWIGPEMVAAYVALHEAGHAHSVEVWDTEGNLVGGAYGVAIGRVFFTESQFLRRSNASKIGFATLNCHLQKWGFILNDGKGPTEHLAQAGFELIPRRKFSSLLKRYADDDTIQPDWLVDETLDVGNWEPSRGVAQFAAANDIK